jgi:hypothetical protein
MWVLPNEELLQADIDKCNNLGIAVNITKVVTDFEDGLLRATSAVFGRQVDHQGCGTAVDLHLKSLQILVVWSAAAKMMD